MQRSVLPDHYGRAAGQHSPISASSVDGLLGVDGGQWNRLNVSGCPFTDHAFLHQLEKSGLVGRGSGWQPRHLVAQRDNSLIAALPLYEKTDSFGEFVFDWLWAEAYQRAGLNYFPKLVAAVPFTPVPGPRLLASDQADRTAALPALLARLHSELENGGYSSIHVLFPDLAEVKLFGRNGFLQRLDCRFLWRNAGFTDFDDFLAIFKARQRKKIRRERRKVSEQGVQFEWLRGDALSEELWSQVHTICASTFLRRGQLPYLDAEFFVALSRQLPDSLLVNLARMDGQLIAASIFFRDQSNLYGRYWGSVADIDCLHFESCYYQGIEYAIDHQLNSFDPGTQGEHKLRRGFAPVESWSLHGFADERMGRAIEAWLRHEQTVVNDYIGRCRRDMPFEDASPSHRTTNE